MTTASPLLQFDPSTGYGRKNYGNGNVRSLPRRLASTSSVLLRGLSCTVIEEVFHGCKHNRSGLKSMKKIFALAVVSLSSVAAFADGSLAANTGSLSPNTDVVTGTGGVLDTIASYISAAAQNAWPFILGIVGVGLLIWLGRAMIRAVRAYFGTAM